MFPNLQQTDRRSEAGVYETGLLASEEVVYREYRQDEDDYRQMSELVFDNALLGQPFDKICSCKQWFADVILAPYIRYQPENTHVAIHKESGRLLGYLTGSMGGQAFENLQHKMVRNKVMTLAASLAMPWSLFDHATRQFAAHIIINGESERPAHPQSGVHWHFQVARDFRNSGIGTQLFQGFKKDAIKAKFGLIWAEVMAYKQKPKAYFQDRGWKIHDTKPTKIFRDQVDFPVHVLCITKPL